MATLDVVMFTSSTSIIIGSGVGPLSAQFTIVRLHGFLEFGLRTADAALSGFSWNAGIGIATQDAFTDIGVTALPNPFSDIEWPGWLWHGQGAMHCQVGALSVGDPSINPVVVPIELKSMRILRQNEVVFLTVQAGETGAATMDVRGMTRMLVKLP